MRDEGFDVFEFGGESVETSYYTTVLSRDLSRDLFLLEVERLMILLTRHNGVISSFDLPIECPSPLRGKKQRTSHSRLGKERSKLSEGQRADESEPGLTPHKA